MRAVVRKWGNSAAVRLPAATLAAAGLRLDQEVEVRAEDGRVVLEPVRETGLDALLAAITPDNLHEEAEFGAPQGGEAW